MSETPRILVFDSGVGGLSVVRKIQQRLPHLSIIYASDNAAFPYGTKGEAELIARVTRVMDTILSHYPVALVVIACNTASTLTLPHLRDRLLQPVVGVVPAIKPAAQQSHTGVIGLLATPATVARPYTHALIREHAAHCTVISVGSSELVQLAEQKLRGEPLAPNAVARITQQLLFSPAGDKMDQLVLACTHFPLLRDEIAASLPPGIALVDSGSAIARRVEFLLREQGDTSTRPDAPEHLALFTKDTAEARQLQPSLAGFNIHQQVFLAV